MGVLSFFRYSTETVVRNAKRSLFAIIGIALAMALVSGSFIAVDSSAYGLLRSAIGNVEVDFVGTDMYVTDMSIDIARAHQAAAELESVKNVEKATPFVTLSGWTVVNYTAIGGGYYGGSYLAFLPDDSERFLKAFHIKGNIPENGTVAVPKQVADSLGLVRGDRVNCSMSFGSGYYNYSNASEPVWVQNFTYLNLSFQISEIWTQDRPADSYDYYPWMGNDNRSIIINDQWEVPIILNMASYDAVVNSTVTTFLTKMGHNWPRLLYEIWINRGAVIDLADLQGTVSDVEFIQHRLNAVGNRYGFSVQDSELVSRLTAFGPQLQSQKLLFLALSLPVVALGVYLSVVGVDLGVNSRRREVGILKSRGASNRQVFTGLILEAVILGTVAAVIGLVVGILVSRFLVNVAVGFGTNAPSETYVTDFSISWSTVELALLFGILLMLLSSYRPFKKVAKTEIAEALHHYSQTTATAPYKPTMDIVFLVLSGISVFSILWGMDWVSNQSDWSWMTRLLLMVLMLVGIAAFPLMPFLLSLGVIRLTTRGSRRLYSKLTLIVKPWTGELHDLVNKNIVRNPKRASNLCVIIALAVAFGLFISVTMESSISYQKETVKYSVGADIQLYGPIQGPPPGTQEFMAIEGVNKVASFGSLGMSEGLGPYGYGMFWSVVMLDSTAYLDLVDPSDFYFVHSDSGIMRDLATTPDSILISQDFAKYNYLLVGDIVHMKYEENRYYYNVSSQQTVSWDGDLKIIGFVRGLPGLPGYQAYMDKSMISWIPAVNLTEGISNVGAFIEVKKGADVHSVAGASETLASQWNWSANARVLEDELAALETDAAFGSLSDFLYTEYAMAIAIMSVGVGLIIFVSVTDRQQELACIMARGASGQQMRKILMGESMSLMALGLIVGGAVGLLTAYMFNTLTQPGTEGVVPHRMIFTYITLIMIAVSIASLIVASLLATSRAGRMRLAEVLRIRGG